MSNDARGGAPHPAVSPFEPQEIAGLTGDLERVLGDVARVVIPSFADHCLVDLLAADGSLHRLSLETDDAGRDAAARTLGQPPPAGRPHPVRDVLASGTPRLIQDGAAAVLRQVPAPAGSAAAIERGGLRSAILVPLMFEGRALGVMSFIGSPPRRPYGEEDLHLAQELARLASLAVDHERLYRAAAAQLVERRRADERLQRSEDRLLLALEAGRLGTWEWEVRSGRVVWSPNMEEIHGREPGSFNGTFESFLEDILPEDRDGVVGTIRGALEGSGEDFDIEYQIRRADGEVRWLEARGRVFRDESGRPTRMAGVCADAMHRKRAEEGLRFLDEASELLSSSLDYEQTLRRLAGLAVPRLADWCLVNVVETGGEVRRLAIEHADPAKQALAHRYAEVFRIGPDNPPLALPAIRTGRSELQSEISEEYFLSRTHSPEQREMLRQLGVRSAMVVPLRVREEVLGALTLVTGDSGRRLGPEDLAIAEELARRAALAVENARLYRQAQQAIRGRDRVFAMVSHDLRAPLNTIRICSHLLTEGGAPPERHAEHLQAIARAADRASRLIGDLLDVARSELGPLPVERQLHDLDTLLREACQGFEAVAARRSVRVECRAPEKLPTVSADRERLLQVLSNLLDNALKFSPTGGSVTVGAACRGSAVEISVADQGPGIPEVEQRRIFDLFSQTLGPGEGIRLGLAISRAIVEAHGGQIWAESAPGAGSTFRFTLPLPT